MTKTNTAILPIITTERLTLRSLAIDDYKAVYELRSDAKINKFLDRQPCKSIEEAKSFINIINENIDKGGTYYWAITLNETKQLVGTICLFDFTNEKSCEIGYELRTKFQGQGIMQEAVKNVIDFVFDTLKLKKILAFTHFENQKSTNLLSKLNFVKTTETDNENHNITIYTLTKSF
ncbi:MAG: GNAT family N-acetyltransferase [Flavobacterium sp.]